MAPRIGVVVFPGTNCEHDVVSAAEAAGGEGVLLWHAEPRLDGVDAVVLPGGFAHGDYLRPGALARFSPVMEAVRDFARAGGPVVGICNGFQVLTEAGLLPGALPEERAAALPVRAGPPGRRLDGLGADGGRPTSATSWSSPSTTSPATTPATPRRCADCRARTASCCATATTRTARSTPSPASPARPATWSGLMPHPERASSAVLGSTDGLVLLRSLVAAAAAPRRGLTALRATTRPAEGDRTSGGCVP